MEDGHSNDPSNEAEVAQVVRVDTRLRIDLKGVVVVSRVLKETVVGVEHLMGQQEEPLPGHTTIVKTLLSLELDEQPLFQVLWLQPHDLVERILKEVLTGNGDLAVALEREKGGEKNFG